MIKQIKKRIYMCDGNKGGVGKSTLAGLILGYLDGVGIAWHAIDADQANASLRMQYGNDVMMMPVHDDASLAALARVIVTWARDENDTRHLVLDIGAGMSASLLEHMRISRIATDATAAMVEIYYLWALNAAPESISKLADALDTIRDKKLRFDKIIVAISEKGGKPDLYLRGNDGNGSKTRQEITRLGGAEITIPKHPIGESAVDRLRKIPYAMLHDTACTLEWSEIGYAIDWTSGIFRQLKEVL